MCRVHLIILFYVLFLQVPTLNAQWVNTNSPWDISSFAASGANLFAGRFGSGGGALLSTDNGTTWTVINTGMPTPSYVWAFALNGANLFAGTYNNGVFLSTDSGSNWTAVNQGLTTSTVLSLVVSGSNLFAGTNSGVFLSTNNGNSWKQMNTGLIDTLVFCLLIDGTNLFGGTQLHGVFRSTNNGMNWTVANSGLPSSPVLALAVNGSNLFAGTSSEGVFISTDKGSSWTSISPVAGISDVKGFVVHGTTLFAGIWGIGVYLTTNNGTNWTEANAGLGFYAINAIFGTDSHLYIGTDMGVWRRPISEMITHVEDRQGQIPSHFALNQNYPNPFNPTTTISFSLPSKSFVVLKVFDLIGREVATLVTEELSAGNHLHEWNAEKMTSGIYFYRLQTGTFTETKKLILMK